jgi:hypothetical protein
MLANDPSPNPQQPFPPATTFWVRLSNLELDLDRGQLFTRHDRGVPLLHRVVFHAVGDGRLPQYAPAAE